MYLLDSDYIIYFLQNNKEYVDHIASLSLPIYVSAISVGEVLEGLQGKRHEKKLEVFQNFLNEIEILSVDMAVAQEFAKIRDRLRKKGELIGDLDTLIAATCVANNLTLLTNNKKHFERVKALRID